MKKNFRENIFFIQFTKSLQVYKLLFTIESKFSLFLLSKTLKNSTNFCRIVNKSKNPINFILIANN